MGVKIHITYSRPDSPDGTVNQVLLGLLIAIHEKEIKYNLTIETSQTVLFKLVIDDIDIVSAEEIGRLPSVREMMVHVMEYSKNHN